jgi:hypothetical protein
MERTARRQSRDSGVFVRFDEALTRMQRDRQTIAGGTMPAVNNYPVAKPMPRYLSDPDGEPDPMEFMIQRPRRSAAMWLIVAGSVALATLAARGAAYWQIVGLPADDAKVALEVAADAAITALKPQDLQAAPVAQTASEAQAQPTRIASADPAAVPASREAIASAYQSALQSQAPMVPAAPVEVPAVQSPAAAPTPPALPQPEIAVTRDAIHRLAPDEIGALLKRADILIASGDVAAARLVLRRPAEAGNGRAAAMLAGTYDAAVLAKLGVRGVVPDMEMARAWYAKAEQFGSPEASRRLKTLASKRP